MKKLQTKYPQEFLLCPIAQEGDRNSIPRSALEAGTGRLCQEKGWGVYNSLPIGEGGIPPRREDFNSVLYLLSGLLCWIQQGGLFNYSALYDYEVGNEVFSGLNKYRCLKENGPSTAVVAPGTDKTIWKNLDAPSVIAGQVTPFVNCKVGGSDGRRLIPWGETVADERYVLCDGGSDGMGGTVPNLIGKFVLPCENGEAGQTGGGQSVTTSAAKISGTIGETVLTVDQIPSHSHAGRTDGAGGHTHTRGTMNIVGDFYAAVRSSGASGYPPTGALYYKSYYDCRFRHMWEGADSWGGRVGFDASRNWSGATSNSGAHTHNLTIDAFGGGKGHTHTLEGAEHTHIVNVQLPPFYKLAYFVKLPE